jgi:putative acetyltransferase
LSSGKYNERQIESLIKSQRSARIAGKEAAFVACHGSTLVGFASLLDHQPIIGAIYVHPGFTRQGIGRRLAETLEKKAIQRNHGRIYVMSSLEAVEFYRAIGYKKAYRSGFWSDGPIWISCVYMQKQLIPLAPMEKRRRRILFLLVGLVFVALMITLLFQ